ncbi:MAG: site-2 protease family protein, partial [Myxococcales bacterium]|nr:site-2 protease family protein [Myxococcales bacterium]
MNVAAGAVVRCPECGAEIAPELLACPGCARLLHGPELQRLASEAESAERTGDQSGALASWRRALELLPAGSMQREAIQQRIVRLSAALDGRVAAGSPGGPGARADGRRTDANARGKAGAAAGLGAVGVALLKSKALLTALLANGKLLLLGLAKLPTLLSMLVYVSFWRGSGVGFALGVVASIYVHEMGHVAALRRYGIEATAPMFVPGFGALVRLKQYPTDGHEDARTGLAGPLWGLFAACVAAALGKAFGWPTALSVASLGASINCFNLIPVWQLDGARGLRPLSRAERAAIAATGLVTGLALHEW